MGKPTVELQLDPAHARDLYAGGVFIAGCGLRITEECDLLVRGAAGEMLLGARVVFVDPSGRGAGLEVVGFGPEMRQRIADLAVPPRAPMPAPAPKLNIELDPEPPEPKTTIDVVGVDDVDVDVDVDVEFDVATQPATAAILAAVIESEPELEPAFVHEPAFAHDPEPDAEAEPVTAALPALDDPPPPPTFDEDLELAPEPIRDVSAGSAMDFAYDPALDEVQTYELETELVIDAPAKRQTVFDPAATQPISLEEMDSANEEPDPPTPNEDAPALALEGEAAGDGEGQTADDIAKHAPRLHERMRGLTLVQQLKFAQQGEMQERILLERIYGKAVWEALLRNPRITAQEVARIARMGALPRPLIEQIVGNGAWLQVPEVRRSLLTHPRLSVDQTVRILRLLPKHELKLAVSQSAYPLAVREHARRILRGG